MYDMVRQFFDRRKDGALKSHLQAPEHADVLAIAALKQRYMQCLNEKDWPGITEVLTHDAEVSYEDGHTRHRGREAIVEYLRRSLELLDAFHVATNPVLLMLDDNTAEGTWKLEYYWHDPWDNTSLRGSGMYADRYVRRDDGWLIRSTGFTMSSE